VLIGASSVASLAAAAAADAATAINAIYNKKNRSDRARVMYTCHLILVEIFLVIRNSEAGLSSHRA